MMKYNVGSPVTIKTWQKPETAHKKSLTPSVETVFANSFKHRDLICFPTVKNSSQVLEVSSLNSKGKFLQARVLFLRKFLKMKEKIILHRLSPSSSFPLYFFLPSFFAPHSTIRTPEASRLLKVSYFVCDTVLFPLNEANLWPPIA